MLAAGPEVDREDLLAWSVPDLVTRGGWRVAAGTEARDPGKLVWTDDSIRLFARESNPDAFLVSFAGIADFYVDCRQQEISLGAGQQLSAETFHHLLLDQIWPRILAHQGEFVLHAAGCSVDGGAVLLLGASGSGKSTLAASFHVSGHQLLSDDAMILCSSADPVTARPVYRSLRMYQDSLSRTVGDSAPVAPVADYLTKWSLLGLDSGPGDVEVPVRAVFILDPAPVDTVRAVPVEGGAGCMALVEQSFALNPADVRRAQERFATAADIVRRVPLFSLAYPRDYACLPVIRDCIMETLDELQ